MNKVILMGRLTKDPELKYTANNVAICKFSIAVKGYKKDQADFFNITTWTKTAEHCAKYLKKGSMLSLVGRLENRSWDAPDGTKRYATDVVANEVYFASSPNQGQGQPQGQGQGYPPSNQQNQGQSQPQNQGLFYPLEDDDELPF